MSTKTEYVMANSVSTRGDVYGDGILLMEMFTAKRTADDIFIDSLSLRKFVKNSFPERLTDVINVQLLSLEDGEETKDVQGMNVVRAIRCIASVLQIDISCSNKIPAERLEMEEVTGELHEIRNAFLRN